ncbi:hypothetical protein [Noviherbaspirillum malthae]|uniref:hypothetical protein n=1 Tax=Noviherbaspirillum malthae TaxID=1260987 RepID=UPI00188F79B4|nr:hypothetical protein [Noviherbaspirillum malthae]
MSLPFNACMADERDVPLCLRTEYYNPERAKRQCKPQKDTGVGNALDMAPVTFTLIPFFFCAAVTAASCNEVPHKLLLSAFDQFSVMTCTMDALRISNMAVMHRIA